MQECGVNLVSLGIFSWSRIQPREGEWDFEWLDRVMDLLHEGGVQVDLATATASPPPWLSHAHPEMLPMLADGTRLWHGARQHYCPSSTVYRDAAKRLVEAMADRYAKHPALAMWHVGNEFGCHVPACYCDVSAEDFRQWLKRRYDTIEELNRAWGTDFWSQRYSDWAEVIPPRRTPTWPNPSQQLDFMRFSSDALLECYDIEHRVLKERTPDVPVTTNFMSFFKPLDYWTWAEHEDIVSNDSYPDPSDPASGMRAAMAGDLMRSLGRGRPWILMEQTTYRVNWREINVAKAPGQMRLWSYQAVARGADGVMFFQWRQSKAGAEKFHSAMVPHGPFEESPASRETRQLGSELRRLDTVTGSRVQSAVALLFDWDSWWGLELPSKPSTHLKQVEQLETYYAPLFDSNITADFARPTDDLSHYRLVLVPNHIRLGGYPQPFIELLGLRVIEWLPLAAGAGVDLQFADRTIGTGSLWTELIVPSGAEVVASFKGGVLDGKPAITRNQFGSGEATYLATRPDATAMARVLGAAASRAGVEPAQQVPQGVEAVRRNAGGKSVLFLLNHRDVAVDVPLDEAGNNLIDGTDVHRGLIRLQPRGVAVIREGW
jgi:beta-galactosidase